MEEYLKTGVKIQVDDEIIDLGKWVTRQKSKGVLKNIQGRTREEIEEDKSITTKEKNRINALLDLGIKPAENKEKINGLNVGKATYDADTPTCIEASTIINDLVEEKHKKQTDKIDS